MGRIGRTRRWWPFRDDRPRGRKATRRSSRCPRLEGLEQRDTPTAPVPLGLCFEANQGQTDARVDYLACGDGYTLFLSPTEAVFALRSSTEAADVVRLRLVGANPDAAVRGLDQLEVGSNCFVGSDPGLWLTGVPNYARVEYQGVYPGVDLVYYGCGGLLEYDFVVGPGAEVGAIRLAAEGVPGRELDADGNLVLHLAGGDVVKRAPVVSQVVNGVRTPVAGRYVLEGDDEVGFAVGDYDSALPLVINPVLSYSTYLGGSGDDPPDHLAGDAAGNTCSAADPNSPDSPGATDALDTGLSSDGAEFVRNLTCNRTSTPPIAACQSLTTAKDTPLAVTLAASDADGDPLSYTIAGGPAHGSLSGTNGSYTYTPATNYIGPDSFTYQANDGTTDSNIGTVSIVVHPGGPVEPPEGLVSWWTGDGHANDLIGGHNGRPVNGATYAAGKVGQAFKLDGLDDYVRIPHSSSLNSAAGFTVEAWIYSTSTSGPRVIVSKWNDNTSDWSYIFKDHNYSDRLRIELTAQSAPWPRLADLAGGRKILLNEWDHVAVTYDTNEVRLYFNGLLDASQTVAPNRVVNASVTDLLIGAVFTGGGIHENFSGLIDEVAYYSRALSAGEIQSIYGAGAYGKDKSGTNVPPVVVDQSLSTAKDTPPTVTLTASDADGDPLTYTIAGGPAHGSLSGSGANSSYTPAADYHVTDSFTFRANDGHGNSDTGTLTITVGYVNDAPQGAEGAVTALYSHDGRAFTPAAHAWAGSLDWPGALEVLHRSGGLYDAYVADAGDLQPVVLALEVCWGLEPDAGGRIVPTPQTTLEPARGEPAFRPWSPAAGPWLLTGPLLTVDLGTGKRTGPAGNRLLAAPEATDQGGGEYPLGDTTPRAALPQDEAAGGPTAPPLERFLMGLDDAFEELGLPVPVTGPSTEQRGVVNPPNVEGPDAAAARPDAGPEAPGPAPATRAPAGGVRAELNGEHRDGTLPRGRYAGGGGERPADPPGATEGLLSGAVIRIEAGERRTPEAGPEKPSPVALWLLPWLALAWSRRAPPTTPRRRVCR